MARAWKKNAVARDQVFVDAHDLEARGLASRRTIYRWIKANKIPPPAVVNGRFLWKLSEIDNWLECQRIEVAE